MPGTGPYTIAGIDRDVWNIPLEADGTTSVVVTQSGNVDISAYLYDPSGDLLQWSWGLMEDAYLLVDHEGPATTARLEVWVQDADASTCEDYAIYVNDDPCVDVDAYEPNDVNAVPLQPGLHTGLTLLGSGTDRYAVDVPPRHAILVDTLDSDYGNVHIELIDGSGDTLRTNEWGTASESNDNETMETMTLVFTADHCDDYSIDVAFEPCVEDVYEPNQSTATAPTLIEGTDLVVSRGSLDRFHLGTVAPGQTISASVPFDDSGIPLIEATLKRRDTLQTVWDTPAYQNPNPIEPSWTNNSNDPVDIVLTVFASALFYQDTSCLEYTTYDFTSTITSP